MTRIKSAAKRAERERLRALTRRVALIDQLYRLSMRVGPGASAAGVWRAVSNGRGGA